MADRSSAAMAGNPWQKMARQFPTYNLAYNTDCGLTPLTRRAFKASEFFCPSQRYAAFSARVMPSLAAF
jgi:hypothetical protein